MVTMDLKDTGNGRYGIRKDMEIVV